MERLQIREVSRLLAQAEHSSIGDAERFVNELFGIVAEGLRTDKQVIVNGLGTFKQTVFKERESVAFTPDRELAEAVNAPFANFKTVEINAEEDKASPPSNSPLPVIGGEKPEPPVEDKVEALTEKVEDLSEQIEEKARRRKRTKNNFLIVAVVMVFVLLIGGGYYAVQQQNKATMMAQQKEQEAARKALELKHKQDSIDRIKKNISSLDLTDEQKREIVGQGKAGAPEYPCAMTLDEAKSLLPRAGYKITGTVTVYTVGEGMTMTDIAQEYGLQQGEFLIQVYNAIESVKEGQKIRIPLVEMK